MSSCHCIAYENRYKQSIYLRMCGWAPTWWNRRSVSVVTSFLTSLISFIVRYITGIAISSTTWFWLPTLATLACRLITFLLRTQTSLCLVGTFIISDFLVWSGLILAWSLFVAAMTTNQDLRSKLISGVHKRASASTIPGIFPSYYNSVDGSALQGVARCVN